MNARCSSACAAIEKKFGEAAAKRELARYLDKGAGPTTRLLRDGVIAAGVSIETLLDVGAGIGALTFELLERGVRRAVAVDASAASIAAARAEAHRRKHAERTEWVHGDFVDLVDHLDPADAVTLDRVLCCYPRYEALLTGAASRARYCLAASYPRDVWFVRFWLSAENAWRVLTRDPFRTVVHPALKMQQLIQSHGFLLVSRRETWGWSVDLYVRKAGSTS